MNRVKAKFGLLIFVLLCSVTANAYDGDLADLYQIDVIVFEQTNSKRFDAESWPKAVGKLNTSNAVNLSSLKAGIPDSLDVLETLDALDEVGDKPIKLILPETITLVDLKHMHLQEESRILKSSKTARLIKHISWTQPLANYVQSTPILLQGGKDNNEIQAVVDIKPQSRNQFNATVDLIFTTDAYNSQRIKEFRVTRDLKLKSKETKYIDHPIIGVMILITPVLVNQES